MNPILNNISSFQTTGANSFTVTANPHNVMVAWIEGSVSGGPIQPTASYNGVNFTFPLSPAYNSFFNVPTPWVAYIINPDVGTHTFTTNGDFPTVAVFYNVDQVNPFGASTQVQRGSTQITSPNSFALSTNQDNSLVLKSSWEASNTVGITFGDGVGETGGPLNTNIFTPVGSPRWSFKPTTVASTYTLSTTWSAGSEVALMQLIELQYSPEIAGGANSFFLG